MAREEEREKKMKIQFEKLRYSLLSFSLNEIEKKQDTTDKFSFLHPIKVE